MPLDPDRLIRQWEDLKNIRNPFESDWRRAALTCLPRQYGGWQTQGQGAGGVNGGAMTNASAATQGFSSSRQFVPDTTAQRALPKYVALLGSLLTPQQQQWHTLEASDAALNKIKAVRDYFAEATSVLFKMRYNPAAWFESAQFESYAALGVYGTGIKFVAPRRRRPGQARSPGIIYRSAQMRSVWLECNDEGVVDTSFRLVPNMTARNVQRAFPDVVLPPRIQQELDKPNPSNQTEFTILHVVLPNPDHDPERVDKNRNAYVGVYLSVEDRAFIGETETYARYPVIAARDYSEPGVPYGYSPASMALGSIGTANAMKKTLIRQGQKAVDPPILAYDDSVVNGRIGMTPGSVIWGGLDAQGRELVRPVQLGDVQAGTELLTDERSAIEDSFFVNLFQVLNSDPNMTATEVMARMAEKASLLAPTMGRLQASDLGPLIERELDVATQIGLLPKLPPELVEARGEYQVVYTSPLSKQQKSDQVAAFMRSAAWAAQVAQQTGDGSILARLNFNAAMPDILDAQGVPALWVNSDEQVAQIMQQRQQAQQVDMAAKAAPAVAGMAKAAAVAHQANGGAASAPGAQAAPAVAPITLPGG